LLAQGVGFIFLRAKQLGLSSEAQKRAKKALAKQSQLFDFTSHKKLLFSMEKCKEQQQLNKMLSIFLFCKNSQ
jgi:hypothetical protein